MQGPPDGGPFVLADDVLSYIEPLPGPESELRGTQQLFTLKVVDPLGEDRWPEAHADALDLAPKQLGYRIVASVTDATGVVHESEPVEALQDEIDTVREEYVELGLPDFGLPVPASTEFGAEPVSEVGRNGGDYSQMVLNFDFLADLLELQFAWESLGNLLDLFELNPAPQETGRWEINGLYRSPVHNRLHVPQTAEARVALRSWHQYGCAADIQTFPRRNVERDADGNIIDRFFASTADSLAAVEFHVDMSELAELSGFVVENLEDSRIGHVHVELHCR